MLHFEDDGNKILRDAAKHESIEITNKMQPCNRIYYSKIY